MQYIYKIYGNFKLFVHFVLNTYTDDAITSLSTVDEQYIFTMLIKFIIHKNLLGEPRIDPTYLAIVAAFLLYYKILKLLIILFIFVLLKFQKFSIKWIKIVITDDKSDIDNIMRFYTFFNKYWDVNKYTVLILILEFFLALYLTLYLKRFILDSMLLLYLIIT